MKPKGLAKTLLGTPALTAAIVVSFVAIPAQAGTDWVGDTSIDWNDPLNWSGDTLYATGDAITVNTSTGNIATITANPTNKPGDVSVGSAAALTGRLDIRAGLLEQNVIGAGGNWFRIGVNGGTGTVNIADTAVTGQSNLTTFGQGSGSVTVGKIWLGGVSGGTAGTGTLNINTSGTINAQSTSTYSNHGGVSIIVGTSGGNGTLNLVNGTVNAAGVVDVASAFSNSQATQGTLNISGGTFNSEGDFRTAFAGSAASQATVNLTGGTLNVGSGTERWMILGRFDAANSTVNVAGGNLNLNTNTDIRFAQGGTGTHVINLNSGAITSFSGNQTGLGDGVVDMMQGNTTANNTFNLNGGTLTVRRVMANFSNGTRTFNFNGGTLKATGSATGTGNASFFHLGTGAARANVRNGGAVIDSNSFNVNVDQALEHSNIGGDNAIDGGLTKNGAGTLTLTNAANTYTGDTLVNDGTLATATTGNLGLGNVTVADSLSAILILGNSNSIADTATLFFGENSFIVLSDGINETVFAATETNSSLSIGPGTYTAAQLNAFFGGDGESTGFSEFSTGTLTVVPEPSAALLGGLGVLGLLRRRRKA